MSLSIHAAAGFNPTQNIGTVFNNTFEHIFCQFGANTYGIARTKPDTTDEYALRVYGTKKQQLKKTAELIGSDIRVEPFSSCLVAFDQKA